MIHPYEKLEQEFKEYLSLSNQKFDEQERLKIDLHCHDYNSKTPDELWGRILNLPETWISSEELLSNLKKQKCSAFTITNHNNAKSCWEQLEKGVDILVGAEFTCTFPENGVSIHVLTYGFSPEQEEALNRLRKNIYKFQAYTLEWNLPTVLPHPLYFYNPQRAPSLELFEKFSLLFERFEVNNGQRDTVQNALAKKWVDSLTEEKILEYQKKHRILASDFCFRPFNKQLVGGSDDHMGFYAGTSGTYVKVPYLKEKLKFYKPSELVLHSLLHGEVSPYGTCSGGDKLGAAFLDYFFQVALHMKDPGLFRIFLHRGMLKDKLSCLAIGNTIFELQRHKFTMKFIRIFHNSFKGKRPPIQYRLMASPKVKPVLNWIDEIAKSRKNNKGNFESILSHNKSSIYKHLNKIFLDRFSTDTEQKSKPIQEMGTNWLSQMELPSHLRGLFDTRTFKAKGDMSRSNLASIFDQLSFPFLASLVIGGSSFASYRVLNKNRKFIHEFQTSLNFGDLPKRMLWLTDTFFDKNGVCTALQGVWEEIVSRELPIDICTVHPTEKSRPHLIVLRPIGEWSLPQFGEQKVRIPDFMECMKLVETKRYDRVMCSTELVMGPIALLLKSAFSIPAYFYMHSDWLEYFSKNLHLQENGQNRLRRILRAFYSQFNNLFVLNKDHQAWLSSHEMNISSDKIHTTAHWIDSEFKPHLPRTNRYTRETIQLLFAGRLSEEKGLLDLITISQILEEREVKVSWVFAGTGPLEAKLKENFPQAQFLGWVNKIQLVDLYRDSDLFVFPSRFDTFGCSLLESLHFGTPAVAYQVKGPKDILQHEVSGFLVKDSNEMATYIETFARDPNLQKQMREQAVLRAHSFNSVDIFDELLKKTGLKISDHSLNSQHHDLVNLDSTLMEEIFDLLSEENIPI